MAIIFPIAPLHGVQFTPPGIPVTWQYDSGRQAWRVVRGGTPWNDITGKPAEFPPADHEHPIAEVTGLQDILNVKQDITARGEPSGYAELDETGKVPASQLPDGLGVAWDSIDDKPSTFPPEQHSHPVVEISDSTSLGQQLVRAPAPQAARDMIGAVGPDDNARVSVKKDGVVIGIRRGVNFVTGTNTTLEITDDVANEEVDVKVNSSGGGGGGSALIVSEIKPAAPFANDMWLDVATGLQFVYYNDGAKSQWIEAIPYLSTMPGAFTKFVFPASPVDGATYNPIAGVIWKWSSTRGVWYAALVPATSYTKAEADAKFVDIIGDTMTGVLTLSADPSAAMQASTKQYTDGRIVALPDPPLSPQANSLWWDADSGTLFIRYNDGTSTQWVSAAGIGPQGPTGPTGPQGPQGIEGPAGTGRTLYDVGGLAFKDIQVPAGAKGVRYTGVFHPSSAAPFSANLRYSTSPGVFETTNYAANGWYTNAVSGNSVGSLPNISATYMSLTLNHTNSQLAANFVGTAHLKKAATSILYQNMADGWSVDGSGNMFNAHFYNYFNGLGVASILALRFYTDTGHVLDTGSYIVVEWF